MNNVIRDPNRKLVTIMQAMELCHVSRRTIYNWLGKDKVEYIRTAGSTVRIYEDSLWKPAEMAHQTQEQQKIAAEYGLASS